jgi:hypothetical protein
MRLFIFAFSSCFFLSSISGAAQTDFVAAYQDADPVPSDTTLQLADKLGAHRNFLQQARQDQNTLHLIFGNLYLYFDYLTVNDYTEASKYMLEAEKLPNCPINPPGRDG